jgi:chromosome segregation ATPase
MADGKELKPKSFRIDDATADKFKEISSDIGGNQQETLAKLIEAYEFQAGKAILTDKKSDIDQFEKYINAITRMFMGSLEDNQNVTETVRTEFDALLKSKDATIQDLQDKIKVAKTCQQESDEKAKIFSDSNTDLKNKFLKLQNDADTKISDLNTMLADKDKLNQALADSCDELKSKLDAMQAEHASFDEMKKSLEIAQKELETVKQDKKAADKTIEELKQHEKESIERCKEQMQMAQDKALLELDKKYQEQIQQLKADKQAEIDKYQAKYLELLDDLKNK